MRKRCSGFMASLLLAALLCGLPPAQAEVLADHPLDPALFTQGLEMVDGRLILSSGLYGRSAIGEVDLATGRLTAVRRLPDACFAEGLTATGEGVWQLTWQEGVAMLRDRESLRELRRAQYEGEGWGLCFDGERLYMSDGSAWLTVRDPVTFEPLGRLQVLLDGRPAAMLNELEYANGCIYANVWTQDHILMIDPDSGRAERVDLSALRDRALPGGGRADPDSVLNGIAHVADDRFYLTGKRWPVIFEVRLP